MEPPAKRTITRDDLDRFVAAVRAADAARVARIPCPQCGGSVRITYHRRLVPWLGKDALNISCLTRGCVAVALDGSIEAPPWVAVLGRIIVTTPS